MSLSILSPIIVGISGASGPIYGIRLLETLKALKIETHLILTEAGALTLKLETRFKPIQIEKLATYAYKNTDLAAKLASGGFRNSGMVIIPCSTRTLAGIANGDSSNLLLRAAEVALKERRKLVLVLRETPFNLIHIENMRKATLAGAVVLPASPGFYHKPKTLDDAVNHVVGKVLDQFEIDHSLYKRWKVEEN